MTTDLQFLNEREGRLFRQGSEPPLRVIWHLNSSDIDSQIERALRSKRSLMRRLRRLAFLYLLRDRVLRWIRKGKRGV
jgi:hypothetical protein